MQDNKLTRHKVKQVICYLILIFLAYLIIMGLLRLGSVPLDPQEKNSQVGVNIISIVLFIVVLRYLKKLKKSNKISNSN